MWPDRVSNPGPLTYESAAPKDRKAIGGKQMIKYFVDFEICLGSSILHNTIAREFIFY